MLRLKLRYKAPEGGRSRLVEIPVRDRNATLDAASSEFKFAAAASFGMLLRASPHAGASTADMVLGLAEQGLGPDEHGYRAEFIDLVRKAQAQLTARVGDQAVGQ
jgi:Ca-activated chloride channel family protein